IARSAEGAADAGTILLKNQFDNYFNRGVETVVFDDGTAWSQADIRARLIAESQTAGDDRVLGSNVADTLRGGKGDDYLNGGEGSDSYHYAQGDGNDTIVESINSGRGDQLALEGIATGQVSLTRSGNDVTLHIAASAEGAADAGTILLKNQFDNYFNRGVETVVFDDGTAWSQADIRARLIAESQTAGDDRVLGSNVADTLRGGKGDD
ncbi:calcium-binding protein, partial [Brenneria alni]|uniref:calcium-binding protein n=1 Tax=Brenneria alni TaxID=71656 RepID=UPI0023E7D409